MTAEEQLQRILDCLDECEREGGDAPHRAVDPVTRLRVLAGLPPVIMFHGLRIVLDESVPEGQIRISVARWPG